MKILVGMSGGVDSSVAAYLLQEQGHEVIGVTMVFCPEDDGQAADDAANVCKILHIPHKILDFKKLFDNNVIQYFIKEYTKGRTPNPCIVCNRTMKWEALLQYASTVGAEKVATGHYAKIEKHPQSGRYALRQGKAEKKDQTYVLYQLTQDQLEKTVMPVGEFDKAEIRGIAEKQGLPIFQKPDSQEICFIPDHDYAGFIEKRIGKFPPGDFINEKGEVLGQHKGLIHYTIGQRKGLGISFGCHKYVCDMDSASNQILLGENSQLFQTKIYGEDVHFMGLSELTGNVSLTAKIRYGHQKAPCVVRKISKDQIECIFEEPQRAATPGQGIVFYDGEYVAGGATIAKIMPGF